MNGSSGIQFTLLSGPAPGTTVTVSPESNRLLKLAIAVGNAIFGTAVGFNLWKSDGILHAAIWRNPISERINDVVHTYSPEAISYVYGLVYRNCAFFPYAILLGVLVGILSSELTVAFSTLWIAYVAVSAYQLVQMTIEIDLLSWHSMLDVLLCLLAILPIYFAAAKTGADLRSQKLPRINLLTAFILISEVALIAAGGIAHYDWLVAMGLLAIAVTIALDLCRNPDEPSVATKPPS